MGLDWYQSHVILRKLTFKGQNVHIENPSSLSRAARENLLSQMEITIRAMYSTPPAHGALIVSRILGDPKYYQEWRECIKIMSDRYGNKYN